MQLRWGRVPSLTEFSPKEVAQYVQAKLRSIIVKDCGVICYAVILLAVENFA